MKKVALLFILLALVVSACENNNNQPTNTNPFRGGTRGLAIQFAEGAPPDEVFDGSSYPFDVEVKLENVGEFDVPADLVKIQLSGINPTDFGKSENDFIKSGIDEDVIATLVDSEGNTIDPPPVFVTFSNLMFEDTLPGNNQFPVRADVCYRYRTEAFADGCIRADVLSTDDDAVCQISEEKTVFNSGSPIHIQQFREQPSGSDKVRYVFKIKHMGSGRFYLPSSSNRCPTDVQQSRTQENRVHFKIESRVEDLQCSGLRDGTGKEGDVLLVNGEATVHCTQQTSSNLDFIDKIQITLDYDYKESTQKELLVKKSIN